ncbi:MAG: alpha/beta fold hydrolase, partial [Bacteroidetes bacterium]
MRTLLFSLFLCGLFACQNEPASPPIEPREVRLELNGTQLFCKVIGQGSPLLVIHGGPGLGHAYFLPHFEKLAQDHTLIFYDQRASGQSASDLDSADISLDLFLKDIDALRAYFGQEKISLLGHSWGGLLAMQYALKYPDRIDKLILSSPSPASSKLRASESAKLAERLTDADKAERAAIIASPEFKAGDARAYERFFRWFFKKEFADTTLADQLRLNFPADFVAKNRVLQYLTK